MLKYLCKWIRKPLFRSTNDEYVDSSRMQWGDSWETLTDEQRLERVLLGDEGPYYTLSLLGMINGIPWFSDRWRLAVEGAELKRGVGYRYDNAYFKLLKRDNGLFK